MSESLEQFFDRIERESKMKRYIPRRWYYSHLRMWSWILSRPRHARYAIQRARRGYSSQDTWDFDRHLSGVIAGGVRELRDRNIGRPVHVDSDEQWSAILTEIADGFDAWHSYDSLDENHRKQSKSKVDRAHDLLKEHWGSLWD